MPETKETETVKSEVYTAKNLMDDCNINITDLDEEMRRQSGLFSHYAAKCAKAQLKSDNMKLSRDITIAKIDRDIRDEVAENEGKLNGVKATEKLIESAINRDVRWVKAQKAYNEANSNFSLVKNALEALKQKRDMLVQLGVNLREEYKGEMRMSEIAAKNDATESARERALDIASGSNKK